MEQGQEPLVFPQNIIKAANDLFEKLKKKPVFAIPAGAALVGLVYLLLLTYAAGSCLVTMLPAFIMLGVFWFFGVKRGRFLLLAGLVGCAVLMLVSTYFFVGMYTNLEPATATSDDDAMVIRDGVVTPFEGDAQTAFNFTLSVYVNESVAIGDVKVLIVDMVYGDIRNETMLAGPRNDTLAQYYYTTTVSNPINGYFFWVNVSGTWYLAADHEEGAEVTATGPMHTDTLEITLLILYLSAIQSFVQYFVIYALIVGMIWWTRRARRMREKQMDKWEAKRKEEEAKTPKDDAKVPSLAKAMGLEADDSFVCSECGADVPGDATECPKCGEKFE
ncbi:MAG: Zinc ribbon protein [Candidatus Thermoplasmatota archaeon]|nr:Zinc ribbon protein [Candidatus Thermoplasmatota archaeon]